MSAGLLLRGGRVIDPRNRVDGVLDVWIQGGQVKAVGKRVDAPGAAVIDVGGQWVVPGLIDLHTHLREPGEEGKETILTGSRAAVAGGFTALAAMPNTKLVNDSAAVTEFIKSRARAANLCRIFPVGAITKGLKGEELSDMGELAQAGCVAVTDDGRPIMSAGLMRRALQYAQVLGLPVMVHEEDLTLSSGGVMTDGPRATRLGLAPIPPSAEVAMVARDLVLLEEVGGHLHLAHLSCRESVRLVREARRRGLSVTAEATPHHFTLTDAAVEGYDTHAKMNPPLRSGADVHAIREALADGTIDAIATDHAPHGVLDKQVTFDLATNGILGLESALPLTLRLVHEGVLSPTRAIELLSDAPARTFRLPGGHLGVGAPADVAVIDPARTWTFEAGRSFSKSRNTPFDGWSMVGQVTRTIVGGRVVYEDGVIREETT